MSNIEDENMNTAPLDFTEDLSDIFDSFFEYSPQESIEIYYANTQPIIESVTQDHIDADFLYPGNETLLNQPLRLLKNFRDVIDIRYKTDYFPIEGKNATKSQDPRYILMEDKSQDTVIKFPDGFIPPPQLGRLYLRVALVTPLRNNQYHLHVHKFQLHNSDPNVLDTNPFFVPITEQHFQQNEIRMKLVLTRTPQKQWKELSNLPLLDGNGINENEEIQCKSKKDIEQSYQLDRLHVAFTLGYTDSQDQFIAFNNTTVISNELYDKYALKRKRSETEKVECPNCSYHISMTPKLQRVC